MEILIAAVVLAVGLVAAASLLTRRAPGFANGAAPAKPAPVTALVAPAGTESQALITTTDDGKSAERRADLLRLEERLRAREEAVESRLAELGDRERLLTVKAGDLETAREHHVRELERVAGMPASQAATNCSRRSRTRSATTARASCARSRRRPSATPTGACATSSRS